MDNKWAKVKTATVRDTKDGRPRPVVYNAIRHSSTSLSGGEQFWPIDLSRQNASHFSM